MTAHAHAGRPEWWQVAEAEHQRTLRNALDVGDVVTLSSVDASATVSVEVTSITSHGTLEGRLQGEQYSRHFNLEYWDIEGPR